MTINTSAQSATQSFFKLSSPEKWWVIFHPFKSKNALAVSQEALRVTDSVSITNQIDRDINGGQLDAFKHSYWMARLSQTIGSKTSIKLGLAHEKGNYQTYKKNMLEDGNVPDKISSDMDLYNNNMGKNIIDEDEFIHKSDLIEEIIYKIDMGKMKVIKKDENGNFLNCNGEIISLESLKGKWKNDKCLVNSNN